MRIILVLSLIPLVLSLILLGGHYDITMTKVYGPPKWKCPESTRMDRYSSAHTVEPPICLVVRPAEWIK